MLDEHVNHHIIEPLLQEAHSTRISFGGHRDYFLRNKGAAENTWQHFRFFSRRIVMDEKYFQNESRPGSRVYYYNII